MGNKVQLAQEWVKSEICGYGSTKEKIQRSLRKKIYLQRSSHGHVQACSVSKSASKDVFKEVIINQQNEDFSATCNVFRTAYFVAKNDRPYVDHPQLIDLQQLNGPDVGCLLHSNVVKLTKYSLGKHTSNQPTVCELCN